MKTSKEKMLGNKRKKRENGKERKKKLIKPDKE